jgi:hypothetical protein
MNGTYLKIPVNLLNKAKKELFRPLRRNRKIDLKDVSDFPIKSEIDSTPVTVHMLWVYGELSALERLSCVSFARNGFRVKLWTYGAMAEVPEGVQLCNAREILPETRIFKYANGSYAGFSNLFRYAVLCAHGGLWADTDVICLMPEKDFRARDIPAFLVTEHRRDRGLQRLNNNMIYLPSPCKGDIIDLSYGIADRFDPSRLRWGDCGPTLLTMLSQNYPALVPALMGPNFANPFPARKCVDRLFGKSTKLPSETAFLHCYNERWRRKGIDKNAPWPEGSLLATMAAKYATDLET